MKIRKVRPVRRISDLKKALKEAKPGTVVRVLETQAGTVVKYIPRPKV